MFSLVSGCIEYLTRKQEINLLIVGLDGAGKTTLLEGLKAAFTEGGVATAPNRILPTVGLNLARFQVGTMPVIAWDLGGAQTLRSIWEKYYKETHAVIYVVDAVNVERIEEAKNVMDSLLGNRDLHAAPFLVLANKHDSPGALSAVELRSLLGLGQFDQSREIDVQPSSALTGERIVPAVEWLIEKASRSPRKDIVNHRKL